MGKSDKLAILLNPGEILPPSDTKFLEYLNSHAKQMNISIDYLQLDQIDKLKNYTALFIRTLTDRYNGSYKWAHLAQVLNLKRIDTTTSISLGSDKHLQFELCKLHHINVPETFVIYKGNDLKSYASIVYPRVLKIPNGAFSKGVYKVENWDALKTLTAELFEKGYYALILQEYMYTDYDWRIGILNHQILFACKYFMVRDHWQVIKYSNDHVVEGPSETIDIRDIPQTVLTCINAVMNILDESLYGIDIKLYNNKAYLLEINDNPSIYYDVEDLVQKDLIYQKILANLKCT